MGDDNGRGGICTGCTLEANTALVHPTMFFVYAKAACGITTSMPSVTFPCPSSPHERRSTCRTLPRCFC